MTNDIYTYIKENFNIEITDYQFKRDYIQNPLKKIKNKFELPYKEDLEYLYLTCNLSTPDLGKLFGCDSTVSFRWLKKIGITKDRNSVIKSISHKAIDRYDNITDREEFFMNIHKKSKQTRLNRYGDENYTNREKSKQTYDNHRNDSKFIQNMVQKRKQTNYTLYGDENYNNQKQIQETNMERYGVRFSMQSDDIKYKAKETYKQNVENDTQFISNIIHKRKTTNNLLYGDENYNNRDKSENTCLDKYGVKHYVQCDDFKEKKSNTIKLNGYKRMSKDEIIILDKIKTVFPNVQCQYYDKEKYPYKCDFYIPEIDTYIEYNGYWTHGKPEYNCHEPYDDSNHHHRQIVEHMKMLKNKFYDMAVYVWTDLDVRKRQTAKNNNLNYLEFFNIDEFNKWFDQQEKKGK